MNAIDKKKSVLVIFSGGLTKSREKLLGDFDVIVAPVKLQKEIEASGYAWTNLDSLIDAGSIYEANIFAEELSCMKFPDDGSRISQFCMHKGYELWWLSYEYLFLSFCLPYTRYRMLLEYVRDFENVHFNDVLPFNNLFSAYLRAYNCVATFPQERTAVSSLSMYFQLFFTGYSIGVLTFLKRRIMILTGDKFASGQDHDFRMKFIFEELRARELPFVEIVRSLAPWKTMLAHVYARKFRPVIYSESVFSLGRLINRLSGTRRKARRRFDSKIFSYSLDSEQRFKFLILSKCNEGMSDGVRAIQIMKWVVKVIGGQALFATATMERNFHVILGCKLNNVQTVGIMHGAQSRHYNLYDFTPSFDGAKRFSVDTYGVWSEWWREYYLKYSKAYGPEQLVVSGPMRPIQKTTATPRIVDSSRTEKIKVLFVSEIVAVPEEVIPYLDALTAVPDFLVYIKFRTYNDAFETWLTHNRPDILRTLGIDRILKGTMQEAIVVCDVVVGSQSTGVIEATLQDKPFVFFNTKKWGDYFDMKSVDEPYHFFASSTEELIAYIRESKMIPTAVLKDFCTRFFGDPYQNGSMWVVEQLEKLMNART